MIESQATAGSNTERRHLAASMAICVTLALVLCILRVLGSGIPVPRVHDEFSYLLGADTFRSFRLANPAHPLAEYFDTFHVLQSPTYASKYPPAQALVLAIGWTIGGDSVVGIWLGFTLMAAALSWMMEAWLPRPWALMGTISVITWLSVTSWAYSYWGGAVAATGGALVYGAIPRIRRMPTAPTAVALGVGLAILANSRPFEGLLAAIPAGVMAMRTLFDSRIAFRQRATRIIVPTVIIGILTVACMGAYNRAVTGRATTFPHVLYQSQEESAPLFVWGKTANRQFTNPLRNEYQRWTLELDSRKRGLLPGIRAAAARLSDALRFLVPIGVAYPLLIGLFVLGRRPPISYAVAGVGLVAAGISVSTYFSPHYTAPIVAPISALYFGSMYWIWQRTGRYRRLVRDLFALTIAIWTVAPMLYIVGRLPRLPLHESSQDWADARHHLADSLAATGTINVLVVRYPTSHSFHEEWVYNGANIDQQRVVWAHDLGEGRDSALTRYYAGRRISYVDVSENPPFYHLQPVAPAQ